jgi:hypothetical protein
MRVGDDEKHRRKFQRNRIRPRGGDHIVVAAKSLRNMWGLRPWNGTKAVNRPRAKKLRDLPYEISIEADGAGSFSRACLRAW